jgi:IS605 OrfB family transposase
MKCDINSFNYLANIITVAIIKYDINTDEFILHIKYKQPNLSKKEPYVNRNNSVASFDPGIRTFLTGYTSNNVIEIGTSKNVQYYVWRQLELIDSINNNENLTKKEKLEVTNKRYERIKNRIKDMHWKVADYLTKNYKTILIGNFSTKKMGENDDVSKMTKRIGNLYSFYQFKQKLQYKCEKTDTNYKHVNEAYTSKCCSRCGYLKKDLGADTIYNCDKCRLRVGRDLNGAKNILMLGLQIHH